MRALEAIAPTRYAGSWDNVGLLVDATRAFGSGEYLVFVTNDMTPSVLDEAVAAKANLIVTYHPTPFSGLKKFSMENPAARTVLTCAANNIAVYSPHTALDVVPGGINDWLVAGVTAALASEGLSHTSLPVKASADPAAAARGFGDGRIATLSRPVPLAAMVAAVKAHLKLPTVSVALPSVQLDAVRAGSASVARAAETTMCASFAVCAGSGASVLAGCKAAVWVTGELSHHDVLAANAAGTAVILTNHSNCERGFLPELVSKLQAELAAQDAAAAAAAGATPSAVGSPAPAAPAAGAEGGAGAGAGPKASDFRFIISAVDADPLVVL